MSKIRYEDGVLVRDPPSAFEQFIRQGIQNAIIALLLVGGLVMCLFVGFGIVVVEGASLFIRHGQWTQTTYLTVGGIISTVSLGLCCLFRRGVWRGLFTFVLLTGAVEGGLAYLHYNKQSAWVEKIIDNGQNHFLLAQDVAPERQ